MDLARDDNSGTVPGIQPDGTGYVDDFLPAGDTRTKSETRCVRGESPDGYPYL
jgi:hypothetical protein